MLEEIKIEKRRSGDGWGEDCWGEECLVYKISRGLMGYGGVEYTYKYTPFCINMRRILLRKSCVVQ